MKQREPFFYYRLVWLVVALFFVPMTLLRAGRGYITWLSIIPFLTLIVWQILAIKYLIRNHGMAPWDWALLLLNIACLVGYLTIPDLGL